MRNPGIPSNFRVGDMPGLFFISTTDKKSKIKNKRSGRTMTKTEVMHLNKPEATDFYNIELQNENMDIIEAVIQDKADKTEVESLKKSVSDGKSLVANAITNKGVPTATDSEFSVMAENIVNIKTEDKSRAAYNLFTQMEEPEIKEGIWVQTDDKMERIIIDNHVLNEGGAWSTSIRDMPYNFKGGSVVLYRNEIHILGGESNLTKHYKLVDDSWVSVSTLPYSFYYGCAVVFNDEIHIMSSLASDCSSKHYSWNGTSWTSRSNNVFNSSYGSVVVWNNEIHLLGGGEDWQQKDMVWNGESWRVEDKGIGCSTIKASAVVYEGKIHVLGNGISDNAYCKYHHVYNGTSWTNLNDLPYGLISGSAVVYNGELHILGSSSSANSQKHYKWDGTQWTSVSTLPFNFYNGGAVVAGDSIWAFGGIPGSSSSKIDRSSFTSAEKMFSPHTMIIQRGNTQNGKYLTSITDTSVITGENNRFISGFDDVWYFGETAFEMTAPMYYGDGTKWIRFKN